jgi:hypothetical protein
MRVPAFRQQHVRAQVHRPSPEARQPFAEDLVVLDVLGGLRLRQRLDRLVERDRHRAALARIDGDGLRRAVDVARRARPLLALAAVHRHLDGVTVTALERLVLVDQRLHRIRAGRNVVDALEREAERRAIERRRGSGPEAVDIDAEDQLAADAVVDLKARLARARVLRQHHEQPPVDGLCAGRHRQRDAESQRAALRDGVLGRRRDDHRDGEHDAA